MPFTPFHFGPALGLGLPLRKYVHAFFKNRKYLKIFARASEEKRRSERCIWSVMRALLPAIYKDLEDHLKKKLEEIKYPTPLELLRRMKASRADC
jgi:hypothetical protein